MIFFLKKKDYEKKYSSKIFLSILRPNCNVSKNHILTESNTTKYKVNRKGTRFIFISSCIALN